MPQILAEAHVIVPDCELRFDRIQEMAKLLEDNGWPVPEEQTTDMVMIRQNLSMLVNGVEHGQGREEEDTKRFAKDIMDEVTRCLQCTRHGKPFRDVCGALR